MGITQPIDTTDFYGEAFDLLANHIVRNDGTALIVVIYSALKKL